MSFSVDSFNDSLPRILPPLAIADPTTVIKFTNYTLNPFSCQEGDVGVLTGEALTFAKDFYGLFEHQQRKKHNSDELQYTLLITMEEKAVSLLAQNVYPPNVISFKFSP